MRPRFDAKKFIAGRPPSGAQRNAKPGTGQFHELFEGLKNLIESSFFSTKK